ncbi:MAG: alpha/beta hydrolase [Chryseolinea sp.]
MKIKNISAFKDNQKDHDWFNHWVTQLEKSNTRSYQRIEINTSLGKTHIWGLNTESVDIIDTLVVFPGARTTSLFWDFDKGLDNLNCKLKIYLVETNGLPNLSDGDTPDIKSTEFGEWAIEVLDKVNVDKAFIAGASFGGLVCMKLCIVNPQRVKAAFLLNPGCLQSFSLTFKNLYYNLLPIIKPNAKNIIKFLDAAVFSKPNHALSAVSEKLIVDYELFALTRYRDNTQKPYYMNDELRKVKVDTYLLEGDKDLLFPFQRSVKNAKDKISSLKEVKVFENVGHGIETYHKALHYIGQQIKNHNR